MKSGNRGFTLIEAMVASVLVVIGVVGALQGIAALTHSQAFLQEEERMQRLAVSKYDELVSAGLSNAATSGDFQDYNESRYKWEADIESTGTDNLQSLRVVVTPTNGERNQATVQGLVFTAPQGGSGTTATAGGTTP